MHHIVPRLQIRHQSSSAAKSINSHLLDVLRAMPKEQKHIAAAQKQRKRIREKANKYSPGRVTLQVLGTGAKGAPSSLYVFSDQSRYLFNCGEGTQRLAHEHKMKLAKLEHVFVTQSTWRNIGGLPGAALTIQDVGVPEVTLHGPRGLEEIFRATHRFIIIKDLEIRVAECNEASTFEDNVMKVSYVPIIRRFVESSNGHNADEDQSGTSQPIAEGDDSDNNENNIDYYAHEYSGRRKTPQRLSKAAELRLQQTKDSATSMAYICRLQPRPGALCLEKCVRFGVPPGPILGKLKQGESVLLKNGTTVHASDVCEPDDPGPVFIVVECPSDDYLDSLIENETFRLHQISAVNDEDLASLVVHFTPKSVMDNPKYKQWIDKFSPSTQHLVLNETNTCMGSISVHRIQHKLNLLSDEMFPLLGDKGTQEIIDQQESTLPAIKKIKSNNDPIPNSLPIDKLSVLSRPSSPMEPYIYPSTLYNHHLRPRKGIDRSAEIKINASQYIDETMGIDQFPDILKQSQQQLQLESMKITLRNDYPKLLFLGTGSSIPNKTRNTSAILLQLSENHNILMDCGEGTYGQIVRFFGPSQADEIVANIRAIYISHLHADHHLGLIGLLQGRSRITCTTGPLLLLAPKQIVWWLNFYDRCFESIAHEFELIALSDLLLNDHQLSNEIEQRLFDTLEMDEINTCLVRHCPNAFGVCFKHRSGHRITYSGDTMPCESLIELGLNSDLLIHEATMEDELAAEAVIKMHSTTSQAIEVGRLMKAKYTVLTHFSQRYAKLPRFNDNFTGNVGIAFDNMQIRFDELPLVPLLYPALKLMFAEHYEELEHKAAKRQMRLEREKDEAVAEQKQ